ncbi:MAG: ferritin [Muribaculaceae bacterium]|nr:ferritin [Muribaculaceae bacterium]
MLSQNIQNAINAQINAELWSAYLYLSMGMFCEDKGMPGVANWFRIQFKEEQAHAEIFMNYVNRRGGRVLLAPIDAVPVDGWNSLSELFEAVLAHEQKVTAMINDLYALAESEHDYATRDQLTWFVNEQVEEEENAQTLINKFRMIGTDGPGLYTLDRELAARVYNVPAPLQTAE